MRSMGLDGGSSLFHLTIRIKHFHLIAVVRLTGRREGDRGATG